MRYSGVGGQAVMEGVMMKNKDKYAVAVRKPNHEIEVKVSDCKSAIKNEKLRNLPIVRGVVNFIESLSLGMKTLMYSASFFEDEEDTAKKENLSPEEKKKMEEKEKKEEKLLMSGTLAFSVVFALLLFFALPYFLSGFFHGAEHKCINCIEHGMELNVENVRKSSRLHKRCGTSFLLIVMLISIVFFMFIRVDSKILQLLLRLLLIPVIAGVSYEFIRLAGRYENWFLNIFSKPGMWMQRLTTKEPDDEMIEVGIASVEAVFDWRSWQKEEESV